MRTSDETYAATVDLMRDDSWDEDAAGEGATAETTVEAWDVYWTALADQYTAVCREMRGLVTDDPPY